MAKYTEREVDPQRYMQSRRRFLHNAGIDEVVRQVPKKRTVHS